MSTHRKIRQLLVEYAEGNLDLDKRAEVETHAATCHKCASDLEKLSGVLQAISENKFDASGQRQDEFWNALASDIEERVRGLEKQRFRLSPSPGSLFESYLIVHRPQIAGLVVGLALIVSMVFLWKSQLLFPGDVGSDEANIKAPEETTTRDLGKYFRKSRVLLIGLSNLEPSPSHPLDLSIKKGFQLAGETRYWKRQQIDEYSLRLVNDLDKILVKLSNTTTQHETSDIALIRTAVERQNLLFKLRMAELAYADAAKGNVNNLF
jgi:hypothetical protein